MLRKSLFAAMILSLGACNTVGLPPVDLGTRVPLPPVRAEAVPSRIQAKAIEICGYLPLAQTAAQLVRAFGGPDVPDVVEQAAVAVCNSVTQPVAEYSSGRKRERRPPKVMGVTIRGKFVN